MKIDRTLTDLYSFPGFRARSKLKGMFGDSWTRIVTLARRQKKRCVLHVTRPRGASTTGRSIESETWTRGAPGSIWNSSTAVWLAGGAVT